MVSKYNFDTTEPVLDISAPFLNSFFNPNVHTINLSTGVPVDTLSLKSTSSLYILLAFGQPDERKVRQQFYLNRKDKKHFMIFIKCFSKIVDVGIPLSDIKDNSVVAISGFNMANTPEYLILELYHQYTKNGHPKNLFVISDALPAIPGRALDKIAENLYKDPEQEFLKGALMPFLGFSPWLQKLVTDNRIECYGWPIGITAYWFREVASGRPGLLTKIGVDTFLDPRNEGAVLNQQARKDGPCKVSLLDIEGTDYLLYQAPKPDYALIRASISDEYGNLSLREEGIKGTILSIAQAAKARPHSGTVIAQVRWLTKSGTISPRDVDVPGPLVNHVVVSPRDYHWQSGTIEYDLRLSYKVTPPITEGWLEGLPRILSYEHERVIARRILLELLASI